MTSRADEIHKLIADIDNLLSHSGNRLSKLLSGQGQEDKEVLQRVRDFLVKLDTTEETETKGESEESSPVQSDTPPLSSLLTRFVEQEQIGSVSSSYPSQQEQSNFAAEQLKDEISVLLQPLQAELSGLLEERATLVKEIRQLEQKRLQNYSLTQQLANQEQIIAEFLQVLISRLVPNLLPHLTRTVANSPSSSTGEQNQEALNSGTQPVLGSAEGTDRLTTLARELDQRLLSLDGTVNVVFSSLERNITTYYQSLSQSLARMHSQGIEGEQLMANFLNNLTQCLQQQSPNTQLFLLGTDTQTTLQPASSSIEELIPDIVAPTQTEEFPTVELDRVLSELTADEIPASVTPDFNAPSVQAEGANEELIPDTAVELDRVLSELTAEEIPASVTPDFNAPSVQAEGANEELIPDTAVELDRVLSELTAEEIPASVTPDFNASSVQAERADEVDQLYASLFGSEDASKSTDSGEVSTLENDSLSASQIVTIIPQSPIIQEQQEHDLLGSLNSIEQQDLNLLDLSEDAPSESLDIVIEPTEHDLLGSLNSVEQQDLNILDLSEDAPSESLDTVIKPTEQLSELWGESLLAEDSQPQAEFASVSTTVESQPDGSDTIIVLTDLLVDATSDEQLLSLDDPETLTTEKTIVTSSVEEQKLVATYISASPQENLLYPENTETEGVPDIVLDEAQLQQLDRDLANFNWQSNSESEQTTDSENFQNSVADSQPILNYIWPIVEFPISEPTENVPIIAASETDIAQSEVDLNQDKEKKEDTIAEPDNDLFVGDNLSDNFQVSVNDPEAVWYLGIDLGTTGISAALLNRSRLVVYPIYWSAETQLGETAFEQSFRLPAEVYLPTASIPHSEVESTETGAGVAQEQISEHPVQNSTGSRFTSEPQHNPYSANLKPYLHVAIPYKNTHQKWEPVLQLNEFSAGPLIWVVRSLSKLLLTLKSDQASTTPALIAHAVGIDIETFSSIINNVTGVVCTCPSSWSEQYRFNVREAILTSKLVSHPQQIFFLEEAIASLLPELDPANLQSVQLNENLGLRPLKTNENPIQGNTLALNIGAAATEMALVDLPTDLSQLTYRDFMLHSFAYAGKAIEQDIICQLLLPPKSRQPRGEIQTDSNASPLDSTRTIPGLDQMQWSSLSWEGLELPRVGEPDISARIRFQQRLESSLLGQALLDAALGLKLILQHQESFTLELADQCWILQRRDLESQVFVPYVRRLNRELNKLLVARGIPTEAINQAVLSGGVAAIGTVNRWLRQKLPNAKIIQDVYLGANGTPNCSRLAYGLAILPLHPQVLEIPRHQYTDYFLFTELLKLLPESLHSVSGSFSEVLGIRSLSFGEILQLFESRGINTRICQQRLLAFLEGELPAGLIPAIIPETLSVNLGLDSSREDSLLTKEHQEQGAADVKSTPLNSLWLTRNSQENPDYQAIASAPLFEKQGNLSYRPNSQQLLLLRRYLDAIKASTLQSLEEPYTVNFSLSVNPHH